MEHVLSFILLFKFPRAEKCCFKSKWKISVLVLKDCFALRCLPLKTSQGGVFGFRGRLPATERHAKCTSLHALHNFVFERRPAAAAAAHYTERL
jgi:hypothetical protein